MKKAAGITTAANERRPSQPVAQFVLSPNSGVPAGIKFGKSGERLAPVERRWGVLTEGSYRSPGNG